MQCKIKLIDKSLEYVKKRLNILNINSYDSIELIDGLYIVDGVDLISLLDQFIKQILNSFNIDYDLEFKINSDLIEFFIKSSDNKILIGPHGQTLKALNLITRTFINNLLVDKIHILIDVGFYYKKRLEFLKNLADCAAKDVLESKISVKLIPMDSFERRVIHESLKEYESIATHSEGENEERAVIISLK